MEFNKPRLQQRFVSLDNILNTYCNMLLTDELVLVESVSSDDVSYGKTAMDERINLATASNIRGPLMHYILYGVQQLKPLMDKPVILEPDASTLMQKTLVQLLVDLKRLVDTSQSIEINIQYDNKTVPIYGCMRDGFFSRGLSKSGVLIQDLLLSKLSLSVNAQENQMKQFMFDAFNEHQHVLLVRENQRVREANQMLTTVLQNTKELLVAQDRTETVKLKLIPPPRHPTVAKSWLSLFSSSDSPNNSVSSGRDIFYGDHW